MCLQLSWLISVVKFELTLVLVLNRIKIVVEKDYHIGWSALPVYINRVYLWLDNKTSGASVLSATNVRSARCITKPQLYSIDVNRYSTPTYMRTLRSHSLSSDRTHPLINQSFLLYTSQHQHDTDHGQILGATGSMQLIPIGNYTTVDTHLICIN